MTISHILMRRAIKFSASYRISSFLIKIRYIKQGIVNYPVINILDTVEKTVVKSRDG
nr:hypothetical protein XNW1_1200007 [Xenorhabdus nematophila str. Websteri]